MSSGNRVAIGVSAGLVGLLVVTALAVLSRDDSTVEAVDDPSSTTVTTIGDSTTTTHDLTTSTAAGSATSAVIVSTSGVVGWWDGSGWVQARTSDEHPVAEGDPFEIIGIGFESSQGAASNVRSQTEFCDPGLFTDIEGLVEPQDATSHPALAVRGVADPLPRPSVELDPGAGTYRDVARSTLADLGIDDDDPHLAQLVQADLDGDGVDEILMVIERLSDTYSLYAKPGDYSVTVLRKLIDGEPTTTVVHQSVAEVEPNVSPYIEIRRVSAIADLNGDGTMEVALFERYYEGGGTAILTIGPDGDAVEILHASCGV